MRQPSVSFMLDLPQNIYDDMVLISRREVKSVNDVIIGILEGFIAQGQQQELYPEYPLIPSPDWDYNRIEK